MKKLLFCEVTDEEFEAISGYFFNKITGIKDIGFPIGETNRDIWEEMREASGSQKTDRGINDPATERDKRNANKLSPLSFYIKIILNTKL
jgi:hypothetical protein